MPALLAAMSLLAGTAMGADGGADDSDPMAYRKRHRRQESEPLTPEQQAIVDELRARRTRNKTAGHRES